MSFSFRLKKDLQERTFSTIYKLPCQQVKVKPIRSTILQSLRSILKKNSAPLRLCAIFPPKYLKYERISRELVLFDQKLFSMKEQFIDWLNKLLVVDVFLVLFSFFWFAIALIGHSLSIPLGLKIWYKLWEPVFTPAIGILMLGAILSWLLGKLSQKFGSN